MTDKAWIIIHTQPNREKLAQEHLRRQHFETYWPICLLKGARQAIVKSLFPRYLFVNLDLDTAMWRPMLSTIGVQSVLLKGDKPASLKPQIIEAIKAQEEEGLIRIKQAETLCPYKSGEPVRIKSGPMTGLDAIFVEPSGQKRAILLLSLFGRVSRVEINLADVA